MQRSALCRSRRELSNAYFVAKFGFDTAENEPSKVCRIPMIPAARISALSRAGRATSLAFVGFGVGAGTGGRVGAGVGSATQTSTWTRTQTLPSRAKTQFFKR